MKKFTALSRMMVDLGLVGEKEREKEREMGKTKKRKTPKEKNKAYKGKKVVLNNQRLTRTALELLFFLYFKKHIASERREVFYLP